MSFRFLFGLIFAVCLWAGHAHAVPDQVVTGYMTTSGCPSVALTPCFVQYGAGGSGPGSNVNLVQVGGASISLGQTTMSASIPVTLASNQSALPVSGTTSNAASGVATSATNVPAVAYNYGFNGTTWDQLLVDTSKNLAVTTTPIAVAPTVSASASVTSLVLKASATATTGGVKHFHAENITTTGGYCVLYNATAAPGTGALTANLVLKFQLLPASGYCDWQSNSIDPPIAASAGAVLLVTSAATPFTYTTGVITAAIEGLAP